MSRCPQCQHENPPGARFCNGCGARAELACAQCGQVNPSGSRFCNGCGAKLGDQRPGLRFGSPEAYTPKHLAERILTSKSCACGSSGAAACGPGGLTAWERGRREGGARARRALM